MNTDQLKKRIAECVTCAPSVTAYQNQKLYDAPELVSLLKDCLKHIEELESQLRERETELRVARDCHDSLIANCAAMRQRLKELLEVHEFIDNEDEHQTKATKKALSSTAGRELLERLEVVEAERDEYSTALAMICSQPSKYAKPIAEAALKVSEAEAAKFMKEYREGKHPLSKGDEAALERSKPELMRRLKALQKDAQPPKQ